MRFSVDGREVDLGWRLLRPYLRPTLVKEYKKGDRGIPKPAGKLFVDPKVKSIYTAEYCLEVGKTYHTEASNYLYRNPPKQPGDKSGAGTRRLLIVSDHPIGPRGPEGEVTLAFRHSQ